MQPFLDNNYCTSARGYYSSIKFSNGSKLDSELFQFDQEVAGDLSPVANLTIHTTQRMHVGTYEIILTEKRRLRDYVYFETRFVVIIEDYCAGAELELAL